MSQTKYQQTIDYHDATKHHFHRQARSLGYMDWANQPNPFRFYKECPITRLPLAQKDPEGQYIDLYRRDHNQMKNLTLESLAVFLELSMGLSAWKGIGTSQWALRMNPSSGNLHPTEAYLIVPELMGLSAGLYHYNPFLHVLEKRAEIANELAQRIKKDIGENSFLVALSSIYWREAWKYGERAFRYCNHDVGHALACLSFSSNLQGWKLGNLDGLSNDNMDQMLGFADTEWVQHEEEHPDLFCIVHRNQSPNPPTSLSHDVINQLSQLSFQGIPNQLSPDHVDWPIITEISKATRKGEGLLDNDKLTDRPLSEKAFPVLSAAQIIRQRRSAQTFDGKTSITKTQFLHILDKTLARDHCAPFDLHLIDPSIHLLIFVHRVDDLEPGLYFYIRNDNDLEEIKRNTHSGFLWNQTEEDFPLYLLETGNREKVAIQLSCQQDIAGDSAFSLGMIARFEANIKKDAHYYRLLFWESGMIGQVLYLEAEAHGVRGTGIGCFFDDPVHDIIGLKDHHYQSLYHFTIGGAIEDDRLTTLAPYDHLKELKNTNSP